MSAQKRKLPNMEGTPVPKKPCHKKKSRPSAAAPTAPPGGAAPPRPLCDVPEDFESDETRNRHQVWMATFNQDFEIAKQAIETFAPNCKWLLWVDETAPTTGHGHIHAGFCLKERNRFSWVKNAFKPVNPRLDYQKKGTSPDGLKKYFSKTGAEIHVIGELPEKKKSTPMIERCAEAITKAKENRLDEVDADLLLRHYTTLRKLMMRFAPESDLDWTDEEMQKHFFWVYGPTGTGKSHLARMMAKQLNVPITLKSINKWWDDYRPGSLVVIDEADPDRCKYLAGFFKQWFDKWTFKPEVKGDHTLEIRPQWMIVTSNYSIEECFPLASDHEPLKRRIHELYLPKRDEGILEQILGPAKNGPGHTCADNTKGASGPFPFMEGAKNSTGPPEIEDTSELATQPMTPNQVLSDYVMDPDNPVHVLTDDSVTDEPVEIRTEGMIFEDKREEDKEDARSYFQQRLAEITCPWK